jgi:uncharacterized protein (TIGR02452 family)
VLGALGCGAFMNPARLIATTFRTLLGEDEWKGYFDEIIFAIKDDPGGLNITTFKEVFKDVK